MSGDEKKKGRGRPPASLKPDARRIAMKLRWTEEEIEAVKAAAFAVGEDVSHFIRSAALARCNFRDEAKRLKAKAKELEAEAPHNSARIQGMADAYGKLAKKTR